MSVYQRILKSRSDLSDWVIHWTRQRDDKSPLDCLLNIYDMGLILPGFAQRPFSGGLRNTIYGPHPAVCFTEQPLREFSTYVKIRGDQSLVSGYAVAVCKQDLFADGGMPVITGLSNAVEAQDGHKDFELGKRNLCVDSSLPLDEQYRYVAFNPNTDPYPIDWSHEREWRWRKPQHFSLAGFPLAGHGGYSDRGHSEGRFAFIVKTDKEREVISSRGTSHPMVAMSKRNLPGEHIRCLQRYVELLGNVKVFSLETVDRECGNGNLGYAKIETHP